MPEWITNIPVAFWTVLGEMAPYLLFGFLAAGVLGAWISPALVSRHLGGAGIWPVVKAAAFGIPLPLCSCGVIPVGASLRRQGATQAATTAFLIATPQDGVDSILVTFSLLGPIFAIFRPIAALVSALAGGAVVALTTPAETPADIPAEAPAETPAGASRCCRPAASAAPGRRGNKLYRALVYGFGDMPRDIGKALLVGLAIAAVISAAVPKDFFAPYLGGGIGAMLVMMLLAIPIYVCATASVPVAAALIGAGVSPGAALVFLMAGPATNAATIATVWKVMGKRTAVIYLAAVSAGALAAGLLLDYVFAVQGVRPSAAMPWMLPGYVRSASAVVLLAVLGVAFLRGAAARRHRSKPTEDAGTSTLTIVGMTCSHCAEGVRQALLDCDGVDDARVDLPSGRAVVSGDDLSAVSLREAVEKLGYTVSSRIETEPANTPAGGPGGK